jgi:nitrate/nitrite transporter NarK
MQNSRAAKVNSEPSTAAFIVAFAACSAISPLPHQIQGDLNLDKTAIGWLIAVPALLAALTRLPMRVLTLGTST